MVLVNGKEAPAGTWTLDPSHSEVGFTVRHAGISKVRGGFKEFQAQLTTGETLEEFKASADIKAASFDSGSADRDAHVRSGDFFAVDEYPVLSFDSTNFKKDGEDEFLVEGNLTIKDTTLPVVLKASFNGFAVDPFGNTRAGLEASTVISRKDFGLTWNAALETGGVLVGDKVTITLDLSFILNQ